MIQISARPYDWPYDGCFSPETTALLVVDMQVDFCSSGGYLDHQNQGALSPLRAIIPRIQALLALFRASSFPIFHTREGHRNDLSDLTNRERFRSRHNPSGLGIGDVGPFGRLLVRGERGHAIIPELAPLTSEPVVDKPGKSAFEYTDLELLLRVCGVRKLVVCGVTSDVCVLSTVRDAEERGYECLLVEDACAATRKELHEAAMEMVRGEGGVFGATARAEDVLGAAERWRTRRRAKL